MDDLVAFLAARLDEDEVAAKESYYEGQRWLTEEEGVYRWPDDELVHVADRKADARHIARHDPARVLREVEAGRAILARHVPIPIRGADARSCRYCRRICPCPDVRSMAAVYGDHPDYRAEWKP